MQFKGIYTPVVTPYKQDYTIDKKAYAEVLESLIDAKVHGIIVAGSTGEYYAQTQQERLDLAEYAKKVIAGRLPLIIGTGAIRTEESVTYAKHAREIGADAILVTTPPYAVPTEEENARHALAIDKAANLPIMLYNYPGRMSMSMGETYLDIVSQSKNVVAIKESSGDINRIHLFVSKYPNIKLACGWDDQALEFFAWGAPAWVCAGSNFIPAEHIALYESCILENDFVKGRKIMREMLPLMNFLDEGKFVQSIKYGCELQGLNVGPVRAPLQELGEKEKERISQIIETLKTNIAAIQKGVK
ncbi:dihydrodipicolinate synthase family protein [Bartonella sp. W8122]|uniref:dihydrodipicolinate synthase family protein n=1 Tax=Bartonella sp. W8122 TaxID=2750930 RepID=UPI0018DDB2C7|nr:dihydrodipicolinate synthase family protein [Bartonella sp. W8122]MBI0000880.1 dihydrodipicolinate synthase family protein [Bartonella sp. W8122]